MIEVIIAANVGIAQHFTAIESHTEFFFSNIFTR